MGVEEMKYGKDESGHLVTVDEAGLGRRPFAVVVDPGDTARVLDALNAFDAEHDRIDSVGLLLRHHRDAVRTARREQERTMDLVEEATTKAETLRVELAAAHKAIMGLRVEKVQAEHATRARVTACQVDESGGVDVEVAPSAHLGPDEATMACSTCGESTPPSDLETAGRWMREHRCAGVEITGSGDYENAGVSAECRDCGDSLDHVGVEEAEAWKRRHFCGSPA